MLSPLGAGAVRPPRADDGSVARPAGRGRGPAWSLGDSLRSPWTVRPGRPGLAGCREAAGEWLLNWVSSRSLSAAASGGWARAAGGAGRRRTRGGPALGLEHGAHDDLDVVGLGHGDLVPDEAGSSVVGEDRVESRSASGARCRPRRGLRDHGRRSARCRRRVLPDQCAGDQDAAAAEAEVLTVVCLGRAPAGDQSRSGVAGLDAVPEPVARTPVSRAGTAGSGGAGRCGPRTRGPVRRRSV